MYSNQATPLEMTPEEMNRLLHKVTYGHIALAFENEAYVVPVSFVYDDSLIWFHVPRQGKVTTYLQANSQACFQLDELCGDQWGSVICYGTATLSDSLESKRQFISLTEQREPSDDELQMMDAYICSLSIDEMTGRRTPDYSA